MIDRLLRTDLEPIAQEHSRAHLWSALTWCWTGAGLGGAAVWLLERALGWQAWWPLCLVAGGALMAGVVALRRWLQAPVDYRAIARQIETEQPDLHALLLTAVEQEPDPQMGELNFLQRRVIRQALELHRRQPWGRRIYERHFIALGAHWLALAFMAVVLVGLRPGGVMAGRWPAAISNGVSVTPGDTAVEKGSGLVVLARFRGKLPAEANLVMTPVNEREQRQPMVKNLDDPIFGAAIPEVKGALTYRIEFTGGATRTFKVGVFEYPRMERADIQLGYPKYTGLPTKVIQDTRRLSAVEGTALELTFYLNKAVASARLIGPGQEILQPVRDTNNPSVYHSQFTLDRNRKFELLLVDEAGRTNKVPPEFVLEALKNRPPELKLATPRGDQRVSALEEMLFDGEASDDFGLQAYGIAYSLGGKQQTVVELGRGSGPHEKRHFSQVLALEGLGAQPDQLLSYYLWAEDFGPDGKLRRTAGDMFFAEVRPFEEIYREDQGASESGQSGSQSGNERTPAQKLAELERDIISATWNLKRRETGASPTAQYKPDVTTVHHSQEDALNQLRSLKERARDPRARALIETAEKSMGQATDSLASAAKDNAVPPLEPALVSEQAASQALLALQVREYRVSRSRGQSGSSGSAQSSQRQIDQLDLQQSENRYEKQRQAAPTQNPEQREQLQVLNRLKELARRQQDINERLKELQTALQEARSEAEREDIRRRLKRLREEEQAMLADVDELRQRMDRPENQSRMADARQELERTRSEIQQAAEALGQEGASQALSAGTRAQRDLQQMQDDFRKRSSSQFADQMRQMRNDARELAQKEADVSKKVEEMAQPKQKTLGDQNQREDVTRQMAQQQTALTNLFTEMRQVSEQAETAEPLLSKQLYEMIRQSPEGEIQQALDLSSQLVRRGFASQAGQFEQRARRRIDEVKGGVERAAESVLGDETEALRQAERQLAQLSQELEQELSQANERTNSNANASAGNRANQVASNQANAQAGDAQAQPQARPQGQRGQRDGAPGSQRGESASESASTSSTPGAGQQAGGQQGQLASAQAGGRAGGDGDARANARGGDLGSRTGPRNAARFAGEGGSAAGGGGGAFTGSDPTYGPLTGRDFVDWSDRLRDVEEMLDAPDLRTEVARVRDRARAVRQEFKRLGKKPDWAVVRLQIAKPLAEVRSRVSEELARRGANDSLVPIDRDPVPTRFSELVRRYYEKLGKSD